MAESIRQQIMSALKTRMQTITTGNGYVTNIGSNVFEWRTTDFQVSELPAMDIRDTGEEVEVRGGNHIYTLTVEIESKVSGATSGADMRDIMADIIKAIGTDTGFSNLVQDTKPVQNESTGLGQNDKKIGSILMTFEMRYLTKAFTPFTLV